MLALELSKPRIFLLIQMGLFWASLQAAKRPKIGRGGVVAHMRVSDGVLFDLTVSGYSGSEDMI
jgi:hypothetical protein